MLHLVQSDWTGDEDLVIFVLLEQLSRGTLPLLPHTSSQYGA